MLLHDNFDYQRLRVPEIASEAKELERRTRMSPKYDLNMKNRYDIVLPSYLSFKLSIKNELSSSVQGAYCCGYHHGEDELPVAYIDEEGGKMRVTIKVENLEISKQGVIVMGIRTLILTVSTVTACVVVHGSRFGFMISCK